MHRRTALTVTGAVALTLAAGSAAMAANLGILDGGNGVNVGDLSPVDNTTQISTPGTTNDTVPGVTSAVPGTTPTSVDDHDVDSTGVAGHDDGIPGDAHGRRRRGEHGADGAGTGTTPTTIDDHGGAEDHRGPGRGGDGTDDHRGPGSGGGGTDNSGPGGGDDD